MACCRLIDGVMAAAAGARRGNRPSSCHGASPIARTAWPNTCPRVRSWGGLICPQDHRAHGGRAGCSDRRPPAELMDATRTSRPFGPYSLSACHVRAATPRLWRRLRAWPNGSRDRIRRRRDLHRRGDLGGDADEGASYRPDRATPLQKTMVDLDPRQVLGLEGPTSERNPLT